jgi:hypothetical protein
MAPSFAFVREPETNGVAERMFLLDGDVIKLDLLIVTSPPSRSYGSPRR